MKNKTFSLGIVLVSMFVLVACQPEIKSKPVTKDNIVKKETTEVSSKSEDSETSDSSNKSMFAIDTTSLTERDFSSSTLSNYKLSNMVKDVVGTYKGTFFTDTYFNNNKLIQLRIKEDGTYIKLTRPFMVEESSEKFYLDKSNTMHLADRSISIDGKKYIYTTQYSLEQGVLVEKFGKLHFISLYNDDFIDYYYNQDGTSDLVKSLISSNMDLKDIPDSEFSFEKFAESFSSKYSNDYTFEEKENYVLDNKIFLGKTELIKSDEVDKIISQELDQLITPEVVRDMLNSTNGLFQVSLKGGWAGESQPKIVEFTNYDKIFEKDGEKAKVKLSIKNEVSNEIFVYQPGAVKMANELNGTYVLN